MAILKRLLHSEPASLGLLGGDRWHLVFDTGTKRLCVVHEWGSGGNPPGPVHNDELTGGSVELDIASFLTTREEGPAQRKLQRLIKTMFDNHSKTMFDD